jgi:hypothetical protein
VLLAALGFLASGCGGGGGETTDATLAFNEIDVHGRDWVEIVNLTDAALDLSGWFLADDADDATTRYALPAGTVLEPGVFLVVKSEKDDGTSPGFAFGLKGGDTLYLLDAAGTIVLRQPIGSPSADHTWGRVPDGTGTWAETTPTQGATNQAATDLAAPLFDTTRVVTVDLTLSDAAVTALRATPDEWVDATFQLTTPELAHGAQACRVRLKGGLSFSGIDQKPSIKVGFNKVDSDARFLGQKNLTLNALVDDPSAVHEVLGYRLFTALGLPSLRTGYAVVQINGEARGLYALLQAWDDVALDGLFGSTGHLYEGSVDLYTAKLSAFEIQEGDEADTADLLALLTAVGGTDDATWLAGLDPVLDTTQALHFMAAESALGQGDGYTWAQNNYYLHSDDDGRFTLLPWGLDQAFDEAKALTGGKSLLATRCADVPECATAFDEAAADVLDALAATDWSAEVDRLDALVRPYCADEPMQPWTLAEHDDGIAAVKALLEARADQANP